MWTAATLWVIGIAGVAFYAFIASRALADGGSLIAWMLGLPAIYFALVASRFIFDDADHAIACDSLRED